MAATGLDKWVEDYTPALKMSPTDIALNQLRDILRADAALLAFADGKASRIQAFSWFRPRDFSLVPGIVLWPENTPIVTGAGVLLSAAKINVGLRAWRNEFSPLGDWKPGFSSLLFRLYEVILANRTLPRLFGSEVKPIADYVDISEEQSERTMEFEADRNSRICWTVGRTVTYDITLDPFTGSPFVLSEDT